MYAYIYIYIHTYMWLPRARRLQGGLIRVPAPPPSTGAAMAPAVANYLCVTIE